MENERQITQPPTASSPWEITPYAVLLVVLWQLATSKAKSLWVILLSWVLMFAAGTAIYVVILRCFLEGDIVLSHEGIHRERRLKTKDVPWKNIIQVIAIEHDFTKVLVLVKKGGFKMTEKCSKWWFFFRNPGKTILLPDDRFTRPFIAKHYGPLDFDFTDGRSE